LKWFKLKNKFYNLDHIRSIYVEKHNLNIEYSTGDRIIIYGLTKEEKLLINKLTNDS